MTMSSAERGQLLALQARVKRLEALGLDTITAAGLALLDDASASDQLTTLGVSAFIKTLLDDADAAAALATLGIVVGTYTPTLTAIANVAASTAFLVPYLRVGTFVAVGVYCNIDPTAAAPTGTTIGVSLPIASNFANQHEAMGAANQGGAVNGPAAIFADTVNDRVSLFFSAGTASNATWTGFFFYRII